MSFFLPRSFELIKNDFKGMQELPKSMEKFCVLYGIDSTILWSKNVSYIHNSSSESCHQYFIQMNKTSQLDIKMMTKTQSSALTKNMYTVTISTQKR